MNNEWEDMLKNPETIKRIIEFINSSDYDFFTEMRKGMTDAEFEDLCNEFPEARIVLQDEIKE